MERGLIKHFYKRPHADQILVTFGLAIVLQEIVKRVLRRQPDPDAGARRRCRRLVRFRRPSASARAPIIYPVLAAGLLPASPLVIIGAVFAFLQLHHLRHGRARRHGRSRDGRPARHRHRQPLHDHVRPCRRGRGPGRRHVHAAPPPNYHMGMDFLVLSLRRRGGRRHGLAARRGAGRVPARHPAVASPR